MAAKGSPDSEATSLDKEQDSKPAKQSGLIKDGLDPKVCGVCGDKALGNNFNAITCESCKAFFRRNALRTKEFLCPFNNNCRVDAITRRFCQRCRLKKCFDIGMKKEWIMTDEEKKMKRHKIEQNRRKRTSLENSNGSCASCEQSPAGKTDGDMEDIPPSPMQVGTPSDSQLVHRLSTPIISAITSSDSPSCEEISSKVQKQPMGSHNNNNEESFDEKSVVRRTSSGIPLKGDSPAPISAPESPLPHSSMATDLSAHHSQRPHPFHYHSAWRVETGDSSSSSLSPPMCNPPSHLKYPPNKRPRMYDTNETHSAAAEATSERQESSPDQGNSPPAGKHGGNLRGHSYHQRAPSSTQQPSHTHFQADYAEDYEHSPHHNPYENGYHTRVYSPPPAYHPRHTSPAYHSQHTSSYQQEYKPTNTMDSILSIAIAAEFNSFGVMGNNISASRDLNKAEQAKLNELLVASQALYAPVDAERPLPKESSTCPDSLQNVVNLTEIAIRRLIKMSKRISGFKNMCQEDQIALLKGSCTEMMILRSVVTYDPDRDSWQIPHSNPGYNINLGVLKEARGNLYEEHQRFVKSFRSEWTKDENIMNILCAITLFTPERFNVIHRDVVKLEQDSYYYLLKRYLESILNGCEAKSNYLLLIQKIAELRALNSSHVRVFLEMNPKEVEPLLIEIFDLK